MWIGWLIGLVLAAFIGYVVGSFLSPIGAVLSGLAIGVLFTSAGMVAGTLWEQRQSLTKVK